MHAHRGARPLARPAVHPRHGAEPGHVLPEPRDRQSVLRAHAGDRAGGDGRARRAGRPQLPARLLPWASRGRAGHGRRRIGRRDGPQDRRAAGRRGRARRRRRDPARAAVLRRPPCSRRSRPRCAGSRSSIARRSPDRRPSRSSSTSSRRSARRTRTASGSCRSSSAGATGSSSKEFTPAMVAGVLGELGGDRPRRRFTVGIDDDVGRTSIAVGAPLRHRAAGHGPRGLLRPRLGRHGRREQEHDQDPRRRRPLRAGVLRLRLEEVRLADHVAPALRRRADRGAVPRAAGRASSAATSSASSERSTCWAGPRTGRRCCSTARIRRTRSGTRCPSRCRSRSSPRGSRLYAIDASRVAGRPACPGARTPCCRPASSRSRACCRATTRSRGSRRRSRHVRAARSRRRGAEQRGRRQRARGAPSR